MLMSTRGLFLSTLGKQCSLYEMLRAHARALRHDHPESFPDVVNLDEHRPVQDLISMQANVSVDP